jgi:hypothetical protein
LEGGLGAGANKCPRAVDDVNRCTDGPPRPLVAGPVLEPVFNLVL